MNRPKNMIMERAEIQEEAVSSSFSHRPPRPACLDRPCFFLVGLSGSGKTCVGRALAEKLGFEFVDVADEIGPDETELDVLRRLVAQDGLVVASLSDSVSDPEVRKFMRDEGKVMYLMASVGTLLSRSADRFSDGEIDSARESFAAELVERESFFHQTLHFILQADKPFEDVVEDALDKARL